MDLYSPHIRECSSNLFFCLLSKVEKHLLQNVTLSFPCADFFVREQTGKSLKYKHSVIYHYLLITTNQSDLTFP
jgi:hypothetical protein